MATATDREPLVLGGGRVTRLADSVALADPLHHLSPASRDAIPPL